MRIPIAKILTTHGIKGELKVSPFTFNSEVLCNIKRFYLSKEDLEFLEVESCRKGPGFEIVLIKFKEISFEEAESLKNRILYVDTQELPSLEKDEFYYYQLIGLEVRDKKSRLWGKIVEIMPMGEYDLILVKKQKESFYIPLIKEYVEEIDLKKGFVLVKDIEALFEVQTSKK